jgi:ribosome modulation factor
VKQFIKTLKEIFPKTPPKSKEYKDGNEAYLSGKSTKACPWDNWNCPKQFNDWMNGYNRKENIELLPS